MLISLVTMIYIFVKLPQGFGLLQEQSSKFVSFLINRYNRPWFHGLLTCFPDCLNDGKQVFGNNKVTRSYLLIDRKRSLLQLF